MILLEAVTSGYVEKSHSIDGKEQTGKYNLLDFYVLDLERKEIWCCCLSPLADFLLPSPMQRLFVAGHTAYLLGGRHIDSDSAPLFDTLKKDPAAAKEYYLGASRLHFSKIFEPGFDRSERFEVLKGQGDRKSSVHIHPGRDKKPSKPGKDKKPSSSGRDKKPINLGNGMKPTPFLEWFPMTPHPDGNNKYFRCTSLGGRLYNFDEELLNPVVFDPASDEWKKLIRTKPKLVQDCKVSAPVIPDSTGNRILMQLTLGNGKTPLYAFSPGRNGVASGEWKCLSTDFPRWGSHVAAVDGVIYFHDSVSQLLEAYEIDSGDILTVNWSSPPIVGSTDMTGLKLVFNHFFVLSDGLLCLVAHVCIPDKVDIFNADTTVACLKFKAERKGKMINFSPDPSVLFELTDTYMVNGCAPM